MATRPRAGYHVCPGGCGSHVPNRLYACLPDWQRLPLPLQRAINETVGGKLGWGARSIAVAQARDWYRSHQLPCPVERSDATSATRQWSDLSCLLSRGHDGDHDFPAPP